VVGHGENEATAGADPLDAHQAASGEGMV
jgi:hypothetical protein